MITDTICAIATGLTMSGIGIIRVSGPKSIDLVDGIFSSVKKGFSLKQAASHTIHYGHIQQNEKIYDEVLVSVMKGPRSYTGEDVVEINCHGGILVLQKILELVAAQGIRLAEPGEFTKRAFLNGRLDLSEAEAVMDLIHSKNEFAMRSSVKQLRGSVSDKIRELRAKIIYEIAFIESALDDPENYDTTGYDDQLEVTVKGLLKEVDALLVSADDGRILKEGITTVILGKPNAGKSSFLNALIGQDRAIVTDIAGTTRDALEESVRLGELSLNLVDTAGIRNTDDIVEKIGVEKAEKYADEADLILFMVDGSTPLDENDARILKLIQNKKHIILLNKSDLEKQVTLADIQKVCDTNPEMVLQISAKEKEGIDLFGQKIHELFLRGQVSENDETVITSARHKQALSETKHSLEQVLISIENGMSEDFYSVDLMEGYSSLGRIIGEQVDDDLVNEIFEKFCMGK